MVIETQFIKMLTYIAYGLREKLQVKENNSYPRSLIFRQGINIFSYLMVVNSGFNEDTLRKFLIENPLLCNEKRQELLISYNNDPNVIELISLAYEDIPSDVFLCPQCGWTATLIGERVDCSHSSCKNIVYKKDFQRKKIDPKFTHRLKLGVMRYICNPGKLELEIEKFCRTKGLEIFLWPDKDKYDIKIVFNNQTVWGVDAKAYSNAYVLANSIENDNDFQQANVDKGFYVVPDEMDKGDYLKICKKILHRKNFTCITFKKLKRLICKEMEDERN